MNTTQDRNNDQSDTAIFRAAEAAKRAAKPALGHGMVIASAFGLLAAVAMLPHVVRALRTLFVAALALALLSPVLDAGAQTATMSATAPAAAPATFVDSLKTYFGSFDTNSTTFKKTHEVDILVSADTQSGITSAGLGLSYNLWSFVQVEEVTRNAGIGGTIVSQQGGFAVSKVIYDLKASAYVHGGYSFTYNAPYAEVGLRVLKALTPNTFAGVGTYMQLGSGGIRGTAGLSLFTGFTF